MRSLTLGILLASLTSLPAAANSIGSVNAAPSDAMVGEEVTVFVTRSGVLDCAAQVDFGDGSPAQFFQLTDEPSQFTHSYSAAGEYTIVATGGRGVINCQGSAEDTVTVTDNSRTGDPVIRIPPSKRGYKGPTRGGEEPGIPVPPVKEGFKDTPLYDVLYETRTLLTTDPGVQVLSCGTDGNQNACNQFYHYAEDCAGGEEFYTQPTGVAIFGIHKNCGSVGYDSGTDQYQISLKNGWHISKVVEVLVNPASSDDSATISAIPSGQGVSDAVITANWSASPDDEISYWVRIEITGPKDKSPF